MSRFYFRLASAAIGSLLIIAITATSASTAMAAHPIYRATLDGPALDGYDTVAYFTLNRAVRGTTDFQYEWRDTTWLFSNAAHLAMFIEDPEKYAPQFGGYCAYAVSQQRLYKGHPEVFTIQDGRLYFNNNSGVMQRWEQDPSHFIGVAESSFEKLIEPTSPAKVDESKTAE